MIKYLSRVELYGTPCVRTTQESRWHRYFFPEGEEPALGTWVVIDTSEEYLERNIRRIPRHAWRSAELDDLADMSISMDRYIYGFVEAFSTAEVARFLKKHDGELTRDVEAIGSAAEQADHDAVVELVSEKHSKINRLASVPAAAARKVATDAGGAYAAVEQFALDRVIAESPDDPRPIVDHLQTVISGSVFSAAVEELSERLKRAQLDDETLEELLRDCDFQRRPASSDRFVSWRPGRREAEAKFWKLVGELFTFPPNARGERIDITDARVTRFHPSLDAVRARRVGNLKPGRACLIIRKPERNIYIAGSERLKIGAANNGGELKAKGVTLTVGEHEDSELNELLIEIEQLELLATSNPQAALDRIDRELSPTEPISIAADRAATDYRWAHMLADLLIEELFEIDADVIRRMIRGRRTF